MVPLYRAGKVEVHVVVYLNRLSDLLFILARMANHLANTSETPWHPKVE